MKRFMLLAVAAFGAAAAFASVATADVKITDRTYVRHDGGTDVTIASCNDDSPGVAAGGERQQNEPTAAIDPIANMRMTAGANDYCAVPTTTDAYAGSRSSFGSTTPT